VKKNQNTNEQYSPSANGYEHPNYYPYPQYETGAQKSNKLNIVVIALVSLIIIALIVTLVFAIKKRNDMMKMPERPVVEYARGSVLINGMPVSYDIIQDTGKTYLPVDAFAMELGYDFAYIDGEITIITMNETVKMHVGSTEVHKTDTSQNPPVESTFTITTPPHDRNGIIYFYVRDIQLLLKNSSVDYEPNQGIVNVSIGMPPPPPGGMAPPPPGAMPPQGGQPQQNTQPPQAQQPPQDAPPPQSGYPTEGGLMLSGD